MTFLSAWRLWFLVGVGILTVAYVVMQRQRAAYSLRFSSSELLDVVAPKRPGFRRHLPAALFLLSLTTLIVGFSQPARQVREPRERATVIIAIDVSLSMQAEDVDPNRLEAAQEAATRFVDELPETLNVGVVSFAGTAAVLVTPTQDRFPVVNAIENLRLAESTAIGEAIFTSLDALSNAPPDETGEPPPARIVLLSDGETTVGRPDELAVAAARDAEVPVSTIAFGTPGGFIIYDDPQTAGIESDEIPVPVGEDNLRRIAESTDGAFFTASTLEELESVYEDIGSAIGYQMVDREITDWFVGAGIAALALTATASLAWFQRLP
ncbi:MAG: VWA domain-containing protein [Actinomycetia bacterium]|nr:VWA domain-containing protein [Actinomycetes bacterium]MCP4222260.1 VWA domain-containing protein [Actinomycetes bacterium]MCP5033228.1 VWA domain-containing protein [Actinomycetes bacterium]